MISGHKPSLLIVGCLTTILTICGLLPDNFILTQYMNNVTLTEKKSYEDMQKNGTNFKISKERQNIIPNIMLMYISFHRMENYMCLSLKIAIDMSLIGHIKRYLSLLITPRVSKSQFCIGCKKTTSFLCSKESIYLLHVYVIKLIKKIKVKETDV